MEADLSQAGKRKKIIEAYEEIRRGTCFHDYWLKVLHETAQDIDFPLDEIASEGELARCRSRWLKSVARSDLCRLRSEAGRSNRNPARIRFALAKLTRVLASGNLSLADIGTHDDEIRAFRSLLGDGEATSPPAAESAAISADDIGRSGAECLAMVGELLSERAAARPSEAPADTAACAAHACRDGTRAALWLWQWIQKMSPRMPSTTSSPIRNMITTIHTNSLPMAASG